MLKSIIKSKGLKVVSLDLPTSHRFAVVNYELTERMLSGINDLMLDMLAAIARKDYEYRRRRQKEAINRAKAGGRYHGRPQDQELLQKSLSNKNTFKTL